MFYWLNTKTNKGCIVHGKSNINKIAKKLGGKRNLYFINVGDVFDKDKIDYDKLISYKKYGTTNKLGAQRK